MEVKVVKIGGNVIDDPNKLDTFLKTFASMEGNKILIHGGGKEATRLSSTLGIETKMVNGRRVTDRETLDVVTMVYAGLINKRIVSKLQAAGCDAIGLCGADANTIRATLRPKTPFDYGHVGDIDPKDINVDFISLLLKDDKTPVFCAINHDAEGGLLNCNADSVATTIAVACARNMKTSLTFCFEKEGVLRNVSDSASLIPVITEANYKELKEEGAISGGMLPKIDNALKAVSEGVESVTIKSSEKIASTGGTVIKK